jgi:hypothetical protein
MKPLTQKKERSADYADYGPGPRPGLRDKESRTLMIDVFISRTQTNLKSKSA